VLEQLLHRVARGGVHSYEELASSLDISEAFLEVLLQDLARLGYLRAINQDCGHHCQSCPLGGCSIAGRGRLWALTDKGARTAGKSDTSIAR
jgi:biotin operon repressor